jgi:hypothetical protein
MNNMREIVSEYFKIKQEIKALEKKADEMLKPQIKSFYFESGIAPETDLNLDGFFVNIANALRETFDLKKARASLSNDILLLVDTPMLVKKTQYPILKVDNKPIGKGSF